MKRIPLRRPDGSARAYTSVSDGDYAWLVQLCSWSLSSKGYARRHTPHCYMQRIIMERMVGRGLKSNELVHHKNERPRDNRRSNLELLDSPVEHKRRHYTHPGVRFNRQRKEWYVRITRDGRKVWLGSYPTKGEALTVARTGIRPPRKPPVGVCFHRANDNWVAYLDRPGKRRIYLGGHPTRAMALSAVAAGRNQYGS